MAPHIGHQAYRAGHEPEGFKVLREILRGPCYVEIDSGFRVKDAGEFVMLAAAGPMTDTTTIPHAKIIHMLAQCGMRVTRGPDDQQFLQILTGSSWVEKRLVKTSTESWEQLLLKCQVRGPDLPAAS